MRQSKGPAARLGSESKLVMTSEKSGASVGRDGDESEIANSPELARSAVGTEGSDTLPMLFCPVCDSRLVSSRCKLLCERCGYFMSCADYY